MENQPQNLKSILDSGLPKSKNKAFIQVGKHSMTKEQAQKLIPMVKVIDQATGEEILVHQYKVWCKWQPEFIRNDKPHYNFMAYMILLEHFNLHGEVRTRNFLTLLREFIPGKEKTSEMVIVYDNTTKTNAGVIYKSVYDYTSKRHNVIVNHLFANKPNYKPYSTSVQ